MELSISHIEKLLKLSQQLLDGVPFDDLYDHDLFDKLEVALFWKSYEGDFIACNKQFAKSIFGTTQPRHIIGKNDYDFSNSKEQINKFIADDKAVIDSLYPKMNIVESVRHANGIEMLHLTSKFPIFSTDGKKSAVFGIMTSVDERANTSEPSTHTATI